MKRLVSSALRFRPAYSFSRLLMICLSCMLAAAIGPRANGQAANENGILPYGTYHGGDFDQIGVSNGHLNIRIPIKDYPQRGGRLDLTFVVTYNNQVWNQTKDCIPKPASFCIYQWNSSVPAGVQFGAEQAPPGITTHCIAACNTTPIFAHSIRMLDWSEHPLGNTSGTLYESLDATGMKADIQTGNITLANGTRYVFPSGGSPIMEDTNGNQIFFGSTIADTLGRNIPLSGSGATNDFTGCTGLLPISSASLWIVPGSNGANETFKLCYALVTIYTKHQFTQANCNSPNQCFQTNGQSSLLQSIVQPDGTAWTFDYSQPDANGVNWGDLAKITFPTGGSISYTWAHAIGCQKVYGPPGSTSGEVVTRTVDANDGTGPHAWIYSSGPTVTDPLGNDTVHTFTDLNNSCSLFETATQYYSGSHLSAGTLLKTVTTDYSWTPNPNSTSVLDPPMNVVPIRHTTTWPGGSVTKTEYGYDSGFAFIGDLGPTQYTGIYGEQTAMSEFDYGSGAPGPLLRSTQTGYLWQNSGGSQYLANNILNVPSSVAVLDGGGNQLALTTSAYDASVPSSSGITVSLDTNPVNGNTRGNVTSISHWLNGNAVSTSSCPVSVSNGYLTETRSYLNTGMVIQSTDACGRASTFQYASTPYNGAYLTSSCDVLNHCTTMSYNLNPGLIGSVTDPNNQATAHTYDNIGRLTNVTYPDGGQTNVYYPNPTTVEVKNLMDATAGTQTDRYTYFDDIFRTKQARVVDPEGDVYSETTYDARGRVSTTSNPHRSSSAPTDGITTTSYDALSRVTQVTKQDGGIIQTDYSQFPTVTVTDEAGKARKTFSDGLGRMTKVWEDPNGLNYETDYVYDVLGNLLSATQNGSNPANARVRTFSYDSLSRLTGAANPESGTISYTYDADGNVVTKTAPAPNQTGSATVTTTYSYDALNRLTGKTYSDGTTPAVNMIYDVAAGWVNPSAPQNNLIGRLSQAATTSAGSVFSYDANGRTVLNNQCTPANCGTGNWAVGYNYDLAGDIISYTTGVGVTFSQLFDSARRVTQLTSGISDSQHPGVLATVDSSVGYYAIGAVRKVVLGNGLTETAAFDTRLQPCRANVNSSGSALLNCGDAVPAGNVQDFAYGFNLGASDSGNLASFSASGAQSFNRGYVYDSLNRLQSMSAPGDSCSGLSWTYDAWANRTDQSVTGGSCNTFHQPVNTNNRISGAGYQYDSAGNMTYDGSHSYTYDAENRITQVDGGSAASYMYDAQGRRVRKTTPSLWTDYIYDLSGNVVSEYTSGIATCGPICWYASHIYFNGRLLADYKDGTTYFAHKDHLGSTRLLTAAAPSTLIQSTGGTSVLKYYVTLGPGTAGTTYGFSVRVTNQGPTAVTVNVNAGAGLPNGTVNPGQTVLVTGTDYETGNNCGTGLPCDIQLRFNTANAGDAMNVIAYNPVITANGGSDLIPAASQNFSGNGWVAWQGSSVTVTQGQAAMIVDSMDYLPYGEQIAGGTYTTHKFTGKERDGAPQSETGFDYFGARYYSNGLGRFTSPDFSEPPMALSYSDRRDPQTLNLYAYVRNNPTTITDQDGHKMECTTSTLKDPEGHPIENITTCVVTPDQPNSPLVPIGIAALAFGHHGLSNWSKIPKGNDAYGFFRNWKTGPLDDPSKNYYDALHRAYNSEVNKIAEEYLKKVGKNELKELTEKEARELAKQILKADSPGIRGFFQRLGISFVDVLQSIVEGSTEIVPVFTLDPVNQRGGCGLPRCSQLRDPI